jgi:hypothetical protein
MKTMTLNQMEMVEGGSTTRGTVECGLAIAGLGIALFGILTVTAATGGFGLFAASFGWSIAPVGAALACLP